MWLIRIVAVKNAKIFVLPPIVTAATITNSNNIINWDNADYISLIIFMSAGKSPEAHTINEFTSG